MLKNSYARIEKAFDFDHMIFRSLLGRLNNLMLVLNIGMFFLTGLVAKGYFYTFYSLVCFTLAGQGR